MKWEGGMEFASEALSASTQVPLARNVLTPADGVVLCHCHCPAHLFTVSSLCKEFLSLLVVFDLVSSSNWCEKHSLSLT